MYIPVSSPPPSPQAVELGEQIAQVVFRYCEENPDVNERDVSQAFLAARNRVRAELGGKIPVTTVALVMGLVLALVVLGGMLFFRGEHNQIFLMVLIAFAIITLGIFAVLFRR